MFCLGQGVRIPGVRAHSGLGGDETIATKIDDILGFLDKDGRAIESFKGGLAKVGWHEGLRQTGSLLRFNLRDAHLFEVEGSFPRLPDDYVPPRGITGIKYTIDVSSRSALGSDDVVALIRGM